MKIIHAVASERNTTDGIIGDQTGKEIRLAEWYNRPWDCYLEPKDRNLGKTASQIAYKICEGNFGYSQPNRWTGLDAIKKNGFDSTGDFDCSSMCISCYILAGANLKPTGYTGNLERLLTSSGLFVAYRDEKHLQNADLAVSGGMYLKAGNHVCMIVEDGTSEEPESDGIYIGTVTAKGSVRVRDNPKTGKTLKIIRKGQTLGILTVDDSTGWLYTDHGWITNNPQYVSVTMK